MGTITDGTGKGYQGKIGSDNRFWTDSITRPQSQSASLSGNSFNINTGVINLTSANKSAVLYVKNNGLNDVVIEGIFYLIGNSTGGSGDMLITVLRNPTAGTIISNASDVELKAVNRNFGSPNIPTIDAYKGAEGNTFTDGDKVIESIFNQSPTRAYIDAGYIILPKGASIGFEITPATGNTSLDVEFALASYLRVET